MTSGGSIFYDVVDFSDAGVGSVQMRVNASAATNLEFHADSQTGTLLGKCAVAATGSAWATQTCTLTPVSGVHTLYVVFDGAAHLNWLLFQPSSTSTTGTGGSGSGTGGASGTGGTGTTGTGGTIVSGTGGTGTTGAGGASGTGGTGTTGTGGAIVGGTGGTVTSGAGGAGTGGSGTGSGTGGSGYRWTAAARPRPAAAAAVPATWVARPERPEWSCPSGSSWRRLVFAEDAARAADGHWPPVRLENVMTARRASLLPVVLGRVFALVVGLLAVDCTKGAVDQGTICPVGQMACGMTCLDVSADPMNCGGCGIPCSAGQDCQAGACQCGSGTLCNGSCVAPDAGDCGSRRRRAGGPPMLVTSAPGAYWQTDGVLTVVTYRRKPT